MSETIIYGFSTDGEVKYSAEIKNSFRGAAYLWNFLDEQYLKPYIKTYSDGTTQQLPRVIASGESNNPIQEIWDLAINEKVNIYERIALYTTFDKCLVRKENLKKIIEAFNYVGSKMENSSFCEQAKILENMLRYDDLLAIGWNQTSISYDDWSNNGGYDENDESKSYNIYEQNDHYFLFDEIEIEDKGENS